MGTLIGAFVAARIGARKFGVSLAVGILFLAGGTMMVVMVGGPIWFCAMDLIAAYLPMAYLGWKVACPKTKEAAESAP